MTCGKQVKNKNENQNNTGLVKTSALFGRLQDMLVLFIKYNTVKGTERSIYMYSI